MLYKFHLKKKQNRNILFLYDIQILMFQQCPHVQDFVCWCNNSILMFLFMKMIKDVNSKYQMCMALKYKNMTRNRKKWPRQFMVTITYHSLQLSTIILTYKPTTQCNTTFPLVLLFQVAAFYNVPYKTCM